MRSNCIPMKRIWTIHLFVFSFILILRHFSQTCHNLVSTWVRLNHEIFREKKSAMILICDGTYTPTHKCHCQKEHHKRQKKKVDIHWMISFSNLWITRSTFQNSKNWYRHKNWEGKYEWVNNGHWKHFYEIR